MWLMQGLASSQELAMMSSEIEFVDKQVWLLENCTQYTWKVCVISKYTTSNATTQKYVPVRKPKSLSLCAIYWTEDCSKQHIWEEYIGMVRLVLCFLWFDTSKKDMSIPCSEAFIAETQVRSPRKYLFLVSEKYIHWIKVSKQKSICF